MKVLLFEPDIPVNTGNIARTCVAAGATLVLKRPLGFSLSDRQMKRAGLDYWEHLNLELIDNLDHYLAKELENPGCRCYFFSSKATRSYTEISFQKDDILIFGSETKGLPDHFFKTYPEKFYTIPMDPAARCLNLSNCAAIILYHALFDLGR